MELKHTLNRTSLYRPGMFPMSWLWCPMPTPVARIPRTRKGWALAWYLTSFLTGSGMK